MWTFPSHPLSANLFRFVLSGSRPCVSRTSTWFVHGKNNTGALSECLVDEKAHRDVSVFYLTCRCMLPSECGYLHYRVQFPHWVTSIVELCHFQLMTPYPGFINPKLIIYWCTWTFTVKCSKTVTFTVLSSYPGYFREPHYISRGSRKYPAVALTGKHYSYWTLTLMVVIGYKFDQMN